MIPQRAGVVLKGPLTTRCDSVTAVRVTNVVLFRCLPTVFQCHEVGAYVVI
jgi:hypothetical protein